MPVLSEHLQVKKKQAACIVVTRMQRNKRKFVTVVVGLEHFGIKLKDAAQVPRYRTAKHSPSVSLIGI